MEKSYNRSRGSGYWVVRAHTVNSRDFLDALIATRGHPPSVKALPGAFNHRLVVKYTCELRPLLSELRDLSQEDQSSFIKALALYEQTVGGIGSPTLLFHALPAVNDPDHEIFDWVLTHTSSYNYYAHGAKSFDELQHFESLSRARAAANLERESQRAAEAAARRADKANSNLFSAIRRGDTKAVAALLNQGARPETTDASGQTAISYAEHLDRKEIAQLLQGQRDAP